MGLFSFLSNYDNKRSLKKLRKIANKIDDLEDKYLAMSDDELRKQTEVLRDRYNAGESLDALLPDAYAVVREASTRVLHMRHFFVQLIGGIVLHQGRIAEMRTGEGKTLVATLPAYLNALSGKPVHIVTVNEYLAKRDSEWMGKIYTFLGMTVGCVLASQSPEEKRAAYNSDITYGTNNEFGFDYLRDNMVVRNADKVARGTEFVIIDEVDSILIDEARTPLIISGNSGESSDEYTIADKFAKNLKPDDYSIDEKKKTIHLTDSGIAKAERYYKLDNLSDIENTNINHSINNALRARFMMKKDNDYIVNNGEVLIVDEFTGRIMVGRRYSDGLHQAIEAKEGVKVNSENKTFATITIQNFFKLYKKISGMTGTAKTEEGEFRDIYGLDVVVIPTNVPSIRKDEVDVFYFSHDAKIKAIVKDVEECHEKGQPVLVGTLTVERSEELSKALRAKKIPHNVLNAKNHMREAEIVAQAGKKGAVTIATNMAGRGTDILLGGNPEFMAEAEMRKEGYEDAMIDKAKSFALTDDEKVAEARAEFQRLLAKYKEEIAPEKEEVKSLGGLRIIGTERHESRRIDNQLKGRAGRQGDPGSTIFYLSADDDLSRVYGQERLKRIGSLLKVDDDVNIRYKMFARMVQNAQKKVEGMHYSMRKQVVEYDDVLNYQRTQVFTERQKILDGESVHEKILGMIREVVADICDRYVHFDKIEDVNLDEFNKELEVRCLEPGEAFVTEQMLTHNSAAKVTEMIADKTIERYEAKKVEAERLGASFDEFERYFLLRIMDKKWIDHIDDMEVLRQGIGLRAYGSQNPIQLFSKEGFDMFDEMISSMHLEVANAVLGTKIEVQGSGEVKKPKPKAVITHGPVGTVHKTESIGRNSPCPCGSGKKYKNCCGKNA